MKSEILLKHEEVLELPDFYEPLLTEKQIQTITSYYRYDLSLGEIAEQDGVSRASVSDTLSKSVKKLEDYENKLGLVKARKSDVARLEAILNEEDHEKAKSLLKAYLEEKQHGI